MRTLQEKYNGVNEGAFSKDQFLRDARLQLPNLVTRFNGYDDAVQILKNRGMIQEEKSQMSTAELMDKIDSMPAGEVAKDIFKGLSKDAVDGLKKLAKSGKQKLGKALVKFGYLEPGDLNEANLGPDEISSIHQEGDSWVVTYRKGDKKEKAFKTEKEARDFEKTINEARLNNKSLTDYRYKVTNEMDKYPYEQILRGLRVELEGLNVLGTPTPEEYTKALAKVLKNLEKDGIFYTNQIAGIRANKKRTDLMIDATPKTVVDKENGLQKAALKEAIKSVIKNILKEDDSSIGGLYDDEEKEERRRNYTNQGDFGYESEFGDYFPEEQDEVEEGQYKLHAEDNVAESKMGDLYILAQEHDRFEHFVQAVEAEYGQMADITELEYIFNSAKREEGMDEGYDEDKIAKYEQYTYTLDGEVVEPEIAFFNNYIGAELDGQVYRVGIPDETGTVELRSYKGKTGMYTEDIFESVSLKDIL